MIMKKVLFIMAVSAMAAGCADNSIPKAQLPELDLSNPLLAFMAFITLKDVFTLFTR